MSSRPGRLDLWIAPTAACARGSADRIAGHRGHLLEDGWMSEYQSYEFVALDRPLTTDQMAELRTISTAPRSPRPGSGTSITGET
jgi:hypothetical protein